MSDDTNGRRWYDGSKVVWSLLGILWIIALTSALALFGKVGTLEGRVGTGEAQRERMEQKIDDIKIDVRDIKEELRKK